LLNINLLTKNAITIPVTTQSIYNKIVVNWLV